MVTNWGSPSKCRPLSAIKQARVAKQVRLIKPRPERQRDPAFLSLAPAIRGPLVGDPYLGLIVSPIARKQLYRKCHIFLKLLVLNKFVKRLYALSSLCAQEILTPNLPTCL